MEDLELWKRFREGDKDALLKIYYDSVRYLFAYGKKITDDTDIIKDSIQDLFCTLINSRENLGKTNNIRFYLIKSFRNQLIKNLKANKHTFSMSEDLLEPALSTPSTEENIIQNENARSWKNVLRLGLKKISPKQREILYYRYSCNFEYDQICEIMSIEYDSARKLVFRALKSLKKEVS